MGHKKITTFEVSQKNLCKKGLKLRNNELGKNFDI